MKMNFLNKPENGYLKSVVEIVEMFVLFAVGAVMMSFLPSCNPVQKHSKETPVQQSKVPGNYSTLAFE